MVSMVEGGEQSKTVVLVVRVGLIQTLENFQLFDARFVPVPKGESISQSSLMISMGILT